MNDTQGSLLYLSRDDLGALGVTMLEVVDAVEAGCAAKGRGEVVMPPKLSLHGEGDAYAQVMAATLAGGRRAGRQVGHAVPSERRPRPAGHQRPGGAQRPGDGAAGGGDGRGDDDGVAHGRERGLSRRGTSRART